METTRPSLLIRVRDRADRDAWYEFDSIYRPMLLRFVQARGLAGADAEEVVQASMSALCEHIAGFDYDPARGRFKAWLRTMVNNRVRNFFRDRKEFRAASGAMSLADQGAGPDEVFDALWRQEHMKHCLRRIRDEVAETTFDAFIAYAMEEQPIEEVCRRFDMTANQVHAIKSRMVARIRQRMVELLGEDEFIE